MRPLLLTLAFLPGLLHAAPAPITPESVAIVYNADDKESQELAFYYAKQRKIPEANWIALPLSKEAFITRKEFNTSLRDPLRKSFEQDQWWTHTIGPDGKPITTNQKIRVLVCFRGVPIGIKREPAKPGEKSVGGAHQMQDEASVDSELSLLAYQGLPIKGALNNPYFKSKTSANEVDLQGALLVTRIDGPSDEICRRMIDDAIVTEKEGLWGMCYLDRAQKDGAYQIGEDWLRDIALHNTKVGIPTIVDRNRDTYVTNYPMSDAALYYGWYAPHRNGPLLNESFRFKRGAIAIHLHSFSAAQLRNSNTHWVGPLLDKGAAATVGNVFEPFLQMTHHFDILHERLVAGHSLAEAAYMSIPTLSWQAVVLGDPLYRPYAQFSSSETSLETDRDYKALRAAWMRWPDDAETRTTKMRSAAARTNSGTLYEALGLFCLLDGQNELGGAFFNSARQHYGQSADRLRQDIHRINLLRQAGRKPDAINALRKLQPEYKDTPEAKAITALLIIPDPPAPKPPPPPPRSCGGSPQSNSRSHRDHSC